MLRGKRRPAADLQGMNVLSWIRAYLFFLETLTHYHKAAKLGNAKTNKTFAKIATATTGIYNRTRFGNMYSQFIP